MCLQTQRKNGIDINTALPTVAAIGEMSGVSAAVRGGCRSPQVRLRPMQNIRGQKTTSRGARSDTILEEVIVTARRQAELPQDVPLSVTAFDDS